MMDMVAGAHMAGGICAALYHKQHTGKGQSLELSLYNTAAWTIGLDMQSALFEYPMPKYSRLKADNPLYNTYQSNDGKWVQTANPTEDFWPPFCRAMGKPEWENDPRWDTVDNRSANCEELVARIEQIMATKTMAEWEKIFRENDIIFGVMQTPTEITKDEQAIVNDFFTEIEHPVAGKIRLLNSTIKFSDTPAEIKNVAPPLGVHTEEVLLKLGYTWEQMAELKDLGVIL